MAAVQHLAMRSDDMAGKYWTS